MSIFLIYLFSLFYKIGKINYKMLFICVKIELRKNGIRRTKMAERVISTANLSAIENNLSVIHNNIDAMNGKISTVDGNVQVVYQELAELAKEFHDYVQQANNIR